jgi:hypothetical protein
MATTSVAAFLCHGTLGLVVLLEVDAICSLAALLSTKGEGKKERWRRRKEERKKGGCLLLDQQPLLLQQSQSKLA